MASRKATPRPRRAVDPGHALGGLRNSDLMQQYLSPTCF